MENELLNKGRQALAAGAWHEARRLLTGALKIQPSAEGYEQLAWACWWLNDMQAAYESRLTAYNAFLEKKDKRGASRTASWLGLDYLEFSGEFAVANGWFQRAENLLEDVQPCRELAIIRILKANLCFRVDKNIQLALTLINETIVLCKQLDDIEGQMLAEAVKGFILVTKGSVSDGMQLLDEATMLALTVKTDDIKMVATTCCYLIDACERIRDYERAGQWCHKVKELCKRWKHRAVFASCRTQYAAVLIWRGD